MFSVLEDVNQYKKQCFRFTRFLRISLNSLKTSKWTTIQNLYDSGFLMDHLKEVQK